MKVDKIKKILTKYKNRLDREFKVKEIGIFGSYLYGKQKVNSDIDVLVSFREAVSLLDLIKLENFLTSLIGIKVDLIPKEDLRVELQEKILKETIYV